MQIIRSDGIFKKILKSLRFFVKRLRMEFIFLKGIPKSLRKPLLYLLTRKVSNKQVREIVDKIENIRNELALRTGELSIIYSPKPVNENIVLDESYKPKHGEVMLFSYEKIARTGKNAYWGTFLHLCACETKAKTIIELGSCAGISASYLGTSPYCKRMISVEGSKELAKIAKEVTSRVTNVVEIINDLFDEAMDSFLPKLESSIDFCFIDGHHEKTATIHYFYRLRPYLKNGAIVIFDDISWSYDMRNAWNTLVRENCFTHCFDLGIVGLCLYSTDSQKAKYWDLQKILGKTKISFPHGWK